MNIDRFRNGFVAAVLAACAFSACSSSSDLTGTGGSGGSNANCTGGNSGDQIISSTCAISGCHDATSANLLGAGLNLTIDSGIGSRLVGVKSAGKGSSMCGGNSTPYLNASSNPATGLLVDKIHANPPCGVQMPQVGTPLTTNQQACIVEWATTLTK
jgi:hypothetical protein